MKNLTDFRKTLEAGVDPRLVGLHSDKILVLLEPVYRLKQSKHVFKILRKTFASFVSFCCIELFLLNYVVAARRTKLYDYKQYVGRAY